MPAASAFLFQVEKTRERLRVEARWKSNRPALATINSNAAGTTNAGLDNGVSFLNAAATGCGRRRYPLVGVATTSNQVAQALVWPNRRLLFRATLPAWPPFPRPRLHSPGPLRQGRRHPISGANS